jgi:hypothetical protein
MNEFGGPLGAARQRRGDFMHLLDNQASHAKGVFVTLRAGAKPLRTLTLGQNTRIWQSASREDAGRKLSRAQANFPCVISGLQQIRISDEHAK